MIQITQFFFAFDHFIGLTPIGNGNINDTYRLDFEAGGAQKVALIQRLNHLVFKQPEIVMDNMLLASKT